MDLTPKVDRVIQTKPQTMSFPTAIKQIKNGKRVRRITWPKEDYGVLQGGWLSIFTSGKLHTWKVSDGDFEGEDYVVIEDKN